MSEYQTIIVSIISRLEYRKKRQGDGATKLDIDAEISAIAEKEEAAEANSKGFHVRTSHIGNKSARTFIEHRPSEKCVARTSPSNIEHPNIFSVS